MRSSFVIASCAIVLLAQNAGTAQDAPSDNSEPIKLFNGSSLDGWSGDSRFWRVEDGQIVGQTSADNKTEKNTFLVYDGTEFADFDLTFQYQVSGFNSGVQYRSEVIGEHFVKGYQSDFEARWHKDGDHKVDKFSGMFFEENGRMFMAQRGQAVIVRENQQDPRKPQIEVIGSVGDLKDLETVIRRDDWNEMRVIAKGFSFTHIINGRIMSVALDHDEANRKASGIIAFQLHSGPPMEIRIKDLKLRRL